MERITAIRRKHIFRDGLAFQILTAQRIILLAQAERIPLNHVIGPKEFILLRNTGTCLGMIPIFSEWLVTLTMRLCVIAKTTSASWAISSFWRWRQQSNYHRNGNAILCILTRS